MFSTTRGRQDPTQAGPDAGATQRTDEYHPKSAMEEFLEPQASAILAMPKATTCKAVGSRSEHVSGCDESCMHHAVLLGFNCA